MQVLLAGGGRDAGAAVPVLLHRAHEGRALGGPLAAARARRLRRRRRDRQGTVHKHLSRGAHSCLIRTKGSIVIGPSILAKGQLFSI